jgi:hypothetical protein
VPIGIVAPNTVRVEEPRPLAGTLETDPHGCSARPGQKARPEQSLKINNQIVPSGPQIPDEPDELTGDPEAAADPTVPPAIEQDKLIQIAVAFKQRGERRPNKPVNLGVGVACAQTMKDGQRMDHVTERTRLDDENPLE